MLCVSNCSRCYHIIILLAKYGLHTHIYNVHLYKNHNEIEGLTRQTNEEQQFGRLKKNMNASRPYEHPPVRGENVKTFRWDHRLQRQLGCCCSCFSHSAYWLPTRKRQLYTATNPARGLLHNEKRIKEKVWQHSPLPPPPPRHAARSEKINENHLTHLHAKV